MIRHTAPLILVLSCIATAQSESWTRFRGQTNTDRSPDTGLLKSWPEKGPKQVWLFEKAGSGYSGFSVLGEQLFTMGTRKGKAVILCLNANTGKEVWSTNVGKALKNDWGDGPRSTPTIDGEFLYVIGGKGDVVCVKAKNGSKVWSRKMSDFGGKVPYWGYSESVLIDGNKVVCAPGGTKGAVVALNKKTGKTIWQSKGFTGKAEYSSVVIAEAGGTRQYVRLLQKSLAGIDAKNGKVLWTHEWPGRTAVIPTPIVDGNKIYITSGYGVGCMMLEIGKSGVKKLWQNKVMKNHHGGVVRVGDHLFGHADAGWVCQKWDDGSEIWRDRGLGKGSVHYADGMLYCVEENSGVVALVEASSKEFKEVSRFTLSPQAKNRPRRGKIWVHPVVINGHLFLRDQEYIYCYNVKGEGSSSDQSQSAWTPMFDGQTFKGWTQRNGTATYRFEGDAVVGKTADGSPNSFLCTDKLYGDFEMTFDVWVHAQLNSGVQIRSQTRGGPKGRVNGPQVEIEASGARGAESGYIYGEAAGGWMTPKKSLIPHKHFKDGEWNTYRILAKGPNIKVWINGAAISDLTHEDKFKSHPRGFIALQVHGIGRNQGPYEVKWRNLQIRELQ